MAEVRMPKLGESVTEGTIGKWLKQVGDSVYKYEPIAEVTTDKVNAEIPSDFDGVLTAILVAENETVQVGALLAVIAEEGQDDASQTEAGATAAAEPAAQRASGDGEAQSPEHDAQRSRYSPVVMRMSQERGIDIARIKGSGIGGRVTRKDVLAYVPGNDGESAGGAQAAERKQGAVATPPSATAHAAPDKSAPPSNPSTAVSGEAPEREEWLPVTAIRRTIAQRMLQSKQQAPHAWMMVEVDVTPLARLREREKKAFKQREGIDLTYLPFFIKATVEALKEFPLVNSTWAEDKIIVKRDLHISIAVATENALVVPVIKHADRLSVSGLASAISELAQKARSGKLTLDDVQGGTFTVNNTGAFGSILSQPIINAPQAAILTVESIVRRPVVRGDDSIAIRSMVNLCMSLDHRVLDGWVSGQFLRAVKLRLEQMDEQTSLY
ncbi:MAG: dihydrolipoamide acetyltransferase family protein [Bacilli bacterium]